MELFGGDAYDSGRIPFIKLYTWVYKMHTCMAGWCPGVVHKLSISGKEDVLIFNP